MVSFHLNKPFSQRIRNKNSRCQDRDCSALPPFHLCVHIAAGDVSPLALFSKVIVKHALEHKI